MKLDRFDWLALRQEEAVDPDQAIVDSHHHLWDRGGSTYLAPQLLTDLTATHNIVKTVFVECKAGYDKEREEKMWPVGETVFAAGEADTTDAGGGPTVAGIVSHADMMLGDAVEDVLVAHDVLSGGRFRGVRHATAWDASDEIRNGHSRPFEQMMTTAKFRAGVRKLATMGFSFDAWVYHPQLPEVAALAADVPELTIVLNHLGGPLAVGPYRWDPDRARDDWKTSMQLVAANPKVVVKLGGIGHDECFAMGWPALDVPPSSEEVAAYWGDDVRFCIDLFGPGRCMFESNFPVDRQALTYPVVWNAFQIVASGYTDAERDDLFSGTAIRVYRL